MMHRTALHLHRATPVQQASKQSSTPASSKPPSPSPPLCVFSITPGCRTPDARTADELHRTAPHRTAPAAPTAFLQAPPSPLSLSFPSFPSFQPLHLTSPTRPSTDPSAARSHPLPPSPHVAAAFVAAQDISRLFFARPRFCFFVLEGGKGPFVWGGGYSVCRVGLSWMLFGIRDDAHDEAGRGEAGALSTGGRTGGRDGDERRSGGWRRRVRCEL